MTMQSVRIALFRIHTWIGLNTCILLGIMFLTGTLLVFAPELENAFYAKTRSGEEPLGRYLTFGEIFDNVQSAYPDTRIANIIRSDVGALFGDRLQINTKWGEKALIWVDPGTGEILGASPLEGVRYMLLSFHDSLFTGKGIGQAIVSLLAFSLLVSLVTGLVAYRRFWRGLKTLPPRGRGQRPWWGGLHRFLAVWTLPFLVTVAVSGIYYFVVVLGVIPTKGAPIPDAAEREAALPAGFNGAMLDRAVAAALAAAPGQEISAVILPYNDRQGISFYGPTSGTIVNFATTRVIVDPQSAAVLAKVNPADFSPKNRAKHFFDALHHGDWAGNYSRVAWLIFGAMGTVLMFSGAMVYASRVARMPSAVTGRPPAGSAIRRTWDGMIVIKWALVPAAIIIVGIGAYRFALQDEKWLTIPTSGNQAIPAKLQVLGPVHLGEPLSVRVIVDAPNLTEATVSADRKDSHTVSMTAEGQQSVIHLEYLPTNSANDIAVGVDNGAGGQVTLTWTLGRPIF